MSIGTTWVSPRGKRTVVKITLIGNVENALVKTGDRSGFDIIPIEELEEEIQLDTARVDSRARAASAQAAERAAQVEYESWDGFTDTLLPRMRAKAIKTLDVQVRYGGVFYARGDLVRMLVSKGWQMAENRIFGVVLASPSGSFLDKKALTKTGLVYATFLLDQ